MSLFPMPQDTYDRLRPSKKFMDLFGSLPAYDLHDHKETMKRAYLAYLYGLEEGKRVGRFSAQKKVKKKK
jgi:hypothetical protein